MIGFKRVCISLSLFINPYRSRCGLMGTTGPEETEVVYTMAMDKRPDGNRIVIY